MPSYGRRCTPLLGVPSYGYYTIIYSSVIVPFAHQRDDVLSLDTAGTDVGQYPLHPIARLEADLTLVHDYQQ